MNAENEPARAIVTKWAIHHKRILAGCSCGTDDAISDEQYQLHLANIALRVVADRARQKAATADRCANQANNDYSANHWIGASAAYRMLAAECDPSTEDGGTWRDQSIRDETESGA